ncbi:hypothetical protein RYX36_025513 [Vicia faba]
MGPKLFGRKKQNTSAGAGSLRGPNVVPYNQERFLGPEQEKSYRMLEKRKVWAERFVRILHDGCYRSCWKLFLDRNWEKLCELEAKLHLEIIYEFYANALPLEGGRFEFKTWVPHSHTSSISVEVGGLLACILEGKSVVLAILIANELEKVALSGTSLGDQTPCQLTYSGLIMGLYKRAHMLISSVSHQVIDRVIDDNFIERFLTL